MGAVFSLIGRSLLEGLMKCVAFVVQIVSSKSCFHLRKCVEIFHAKNVHPFYYLCYHNMGPR